MGEQAFQLLGDLTFNMASRFLTLGRRTKSASKRFIHISAQLTYIYLLFDVLITASLLFHRLFLKKGYQRHRRVLAPEKRNVTYEKLLGARVFWLLWPDSFLGVAEGKKPDL